MEITFNKRRLLTFADQSKEFFSDAVGYLFIALFIYTAASKLASFETFEQVLSRSPLIGDYSTPIAWAIPLAEIAISTLLIIPITKRKGLYLSLLLMLLFTVYLIYMLYSGSQLPCHCGGVISSMSWKGHVLFNAGFIVLGLGGLAVYRER
eukprot:gene9985-11658_t